MAQSGFTLVELLVVMGVMVILAALTLPIVRSMLLDQKVSQAATMVQQYLEAARARAVATGQPVAVILDRLRYDAGGGLSGNDVLVAANTCVRLSTGEVFPPYTGDWAGTTGTLTDGNGDGHVDQLRVPIAMAGSLFMTTSGGNTVPSGMALAGDLIQLGTRREVFVLSGDPALDTTTGEAVISFYNPPVTTVAGSTYPRPDGAWRGGAGKQVTFRIFRRPSKSLAGGVSLPRGTCIDMHFSGFGQTGREFSSDWIHQTGSMASPYPPTGAGANPDYGPIYIVFAPDGTVLSWYHQDRSASVTAPRLKPASAGATIHLLVGRTDGVPGSPLLDPTQALSFNDLFKSNIMDSRNTWVSINSFTGNIFTSPVTATTAPSPGFANAIDDRVAQARIIATYGITEVSE